MWATVVDACNAYNNNSMCGGTIHPWYCDAAAMYCSQNITDSCCTNMWNSPDDACNDYSLNCGKTIAPYWCNAAQQYCTTNTTDSCCTNMWATADDACFAFNNNSACVINLGNVLNYNIEWIPAVAEGGESVLETLESDVIE